MLIFNIYKTRRLKKSYLSLRKYKEGVIGLGLIGSWKVIKVRRSHFFGRYRFFDRLLLYFGVIAQEVIEDDEENDESTHSSAVEVEFVFHVV